MRAFIAGLLLASVLPLGMFPATAANTVSAGLANVSYSLVDLAPNDGIAASLSFLAPAGTTRPSFLLISLYDDISGTSSEKFSEGSAALSPLSVDVATDTIIGSAKLSGSGIPDLTLHADLNIVAPTGSRSSGVAAIGSGLVEFVLSPMTSVTFTVVSAIDASMSILPLGSSGGDFSYLLATTYMWVQGSSTADDGEWSSRVFLLLPGDEIRDFFNLTLTLENNLDLTATRQLYFGAHVEAVPEPAQWLIMLLGIAVVAARLPHLSNGAGALHYRSTA